MAPGTAQAQHVVPLPDRGRTPAPQKAHGFAPTTAVLYGGVEGVDAGLEGDGAGQGGDDAAIGADLVQGEDASRRSLSHFLLAYLVAADLVGPDVGRTGRTTGRR